MKNRLNGFISPPLWLVVHSNITYFWYVTDTFEGPEGVEKYLLYSGICSIPESFDRREFVSVSRAVCRAACSNIFDNDCSGFLYNRSTQSCTLSP